MSNARGGKVVLGAAAALAVALLDPVASSGAGLEAGEEHFRRTDLDDNGSISPGEYERRMAEVFYSADRDRDSLLDPGELGEVEPDLQPGAADRDGSGAVDWTEFLAARARDFRRVDVDGDGRLSRQEVLEDYGP